MWRNFAQLSTLTANILETDQDIENQKQNLLRAIPVWQKISNLWSTNKKVIGAHVDPS